MTSTTMFSGTSQIGKSNGIAATATAGTTGGGGGGGYASTAIGGEEILSTSQLRAEAEAAEQVLEEFSALCLRIGEWCRDLPERYVAAPFGTDALTSAVNHVTEAEGDGTAIGEAVAEMVSALDEADSLGEKVAELAADGHVDAFKTS